MGMFDKDKEIGLILTNEFERGQEFILHNAVVDAEPVKTDIGDARKTRLTVSKMDAPRDTYEVTTLGSAIADKAEEAEDSDFPAVVKWLQVSGRFGNDATVLQFVKPYGASTT